MELWKVFGGRSEYLAAPLRTVRRVRIILSEKRKAEKEEADKQNAETESARRQAESARRQT